MPFFPASVPNRNANCRPRLRGACSRRPTAVPGAIRAGQSPARLPLRSKGEGRRAAVEFIFSLLRLLAEWLNLAWDERERRIVEIGALAGHGEVFTYRCDIHLFVPLLRWAACEAY